MLDLSQSGIAIKALTLADIELVRQWRNSPSILNNMEYQLEISVEKQFLWFNSLPNQTCYYFIIWVNEVKVGLVHLNKFENNTAHVGLFIGNESYVGTGVSLGASVLILSFAFEELQLNQLFAKVKITNQIAIGYNQSLGFEFSNALNDTFSEFIITKQKYLQKADYLKKLVQTAMQ